MDMLPDDEHVQLMEAVRAFLDQRCPVTVPSDPHSPPSFDPELWSQLCGDLGLVGLAVPERFGGSGYGMRELGYVMEEAGRVLLSAPLLSTALAAQALLVSGDEAMCASHLPRLVSGEVCASVACVPDIRTGSRPRAVRTADGWIVSGTAGFVLDGHLDGLLVVFCDSDEGPTAFVVGPSGAGLDRRSLTTLDLTRPQAEVDLDAVPGTVLGAVGQGDALLAQVRDLASVLLACEQVGAAARTLELAVSYAKVREQFGRAIGSFQAVKHRCADMYVQVEAARAAARHAALVADQRPGELPVAARVASSYVADAFAFTAAENIQVHGGIGFTWEHPSHLYYRRARSTSLLLRPRDARDSLVSLLGA